MQVRVIAFVAPIGDTCTSFATSPVLSRKCCANVGMKIGDRPIFRHEKNIPAAHLTYDVANGP